MVKEIIAIAFFTIIIVLTVFMFSFMIVTEGPKVTGWVSEWFCLNTNCPINDVVESCSGLNVSVAPFETFCTDQEMKYDSGSFFGEGSCIDSSGEKHYYGVEFENEIWYIGNKNYEAEYSCK